MAQTPEGAIKCAAKRMGINIEEYISHMKIGERRCSKCKNWKIKEFFPQNSGPKNSISGTCLECSRVVFKKSTKGRPAYFKGKQHTPLAKTMMSQAHSGQNNHRWKNGVSYRKTPRNKDHIMAKRAVNHAIESGKMVKASILPCFDCGCKAKEYHHYRGYSSVNWFDVQALCIRCHRKRHIVDK